MKLDKIKYKIDRYFDNISPEEVIEGFKKYGYTFKQTNLSKWGKLFDNQMFCWHSMEHHFCGARPDSKYSYICCDCINEFLNYKFGNSNFKRLILFIRLFIWHQKCVFIQKYSFKVRSIRDWFKYYRKGETPF